MEKEKESGDKAMKAQDFGEAVFHYTEALKLPGDDSIAVKVHANLAAAYTSQKEYMKAVKEADRAIRLDPNYAKAHLRRGNALEFQNNLAAAMSAYKAGIAIDPDDASLSKAADKLAIRIEEQKAKSATAVLEQKNAPKKEAEELKKKANELFNKKQDYKGAAEMYSKAIVAGERESYADLHVLYSNRSLMRLKLSNPEGALEDAEKCVELKPDFPVGYSRKGDALQKLEKHDEARAAYLKGLKLNPMNQNLKAAVAAEDKALGYDQQHEHIQGADGMAADDDEEQDLYVILGLSKEDEPEEHDINKAYKKLAARWHPDKNPGDVQADAMMRKINFAKDVLTNPIKRRAYDKYGSQGLQMVDQFGEEGYEQVEAMEPYMCPIMCCLCILSIPTLCFCCCCFCCCCGALKKDVDEDDFENPDLSDLDEEDNHSAPGQYE